MSAVRHSSQSGAKTEQIFIKKITTSQCVMSKDDKKVPIAYTQRMKTLEYANCVLNTHLRSRLKLELAPSGLMQRENIIERNTPPCVETPKLRAPGLNHTPVGRIDVVQRVPQLLDPIGASVMLCSHY